MTAKITDKLKKQLVQQIFDEVTGTKIGDSDNYYYIAVGRSQSWTDENAPDTPNPVERDERLFRYDVQSVKSIEAFSYVVDLKDWTSGSTYVQYSDAAVGQGTEFYVRTDENHVYLCIRQGKDQFGAPNISTVKPDHTDTTTPIELDGYVWKYMYTISTADGNSFLSANWMPVKYVDSAIPTDPYYAQYQIKQFADSSQIVGYRVINGGTGYSNTDTISIIGDGTGAAARLVVNASGVIAAVEVGDSANVGTTGYPSITSKMGTGYNKASVAITSAAGTGASIVPVFSPKNGLGYNPVDDFRSTALMFNIKPEGNVNGKWIVDNQYRQVGLWKNPLIYNSATKFTSTEGTALGKIILSAPASITFDQNVYVKSTTTAALGIIDYADSNEIWYHQNETTGFTAFSSTSPNNTVNIVEDIDGNTVQAGGSNLTVSSFVDPELDIYSGDILYINNQTDVPRNISGSEDIKLVVKL